MASPVREAIQSVFASLFPSSTFNLSCHKESAAFEFISGHDTFVSLPTGHGKSLIYQLVIPVVTKLSHINDNLSRVFPNRPLLLVVSPLQALVSDQIKSCERLGLSCMKLEDAVEETISTDIVFTSPEILERHLHVFRRHSERFIGIVVDESHCVVNWGTATKKGTNPFRAAYSEIGNIRAVIKAPILCLTATANHKTRQKIIQILHMEKTKLVYMSPEKENVKLCVEQPGKGAELEDILKWLIEDIKEYGQETQKTVIFCSSFKECGDIFDILDEYVPVPQHMHIAMFHSKTPQRLKNKVLQEFVKMESIIRVVVATSALGMGVNIPDIRRVVHFGVPQDIESYTLAVGRGGRDGSEVCAVLYYRSYHLRHCDNEIREFVKNKVDCRRLLVLKHFKEKPRQNITLHRWCDICALACDCGDCSLESHKKSYDGAYGNTLNVETFHRNVLKEIREQNVRNQCTTVMGSKFMENMLSDSVIEELSDNLENIFSTEFIMENFPIVDERVAIDIISVVDDIFKDITEVVSAKMLDFNSLDFPHLMEDLSASETSSDSSF